MVEYKNFDKSYSYSKVVHIDIKTLLLNVYEKFLFQFINFDPKHSKETITKQVVHIDIKTFLLNVYEQFFSVYKLLSKA